MERFSNSRSAILHIGFADIGEVKHTTAPETFATGLRELSEYLYFARANTEYLFDTSASSVSVTGLICTDGVATAADSSHEITHLTADDF